MFKQLTLIGLTSALSLKTQSEAKWGCFYHDNCSSEKDYDFLDMMLFFDYWNLFKFSVDGNTPMPRDTALEGATSLLHCGITLDTAAAKRNLDSMVSYFSNLDYEWLDNSPW